MTATEDLYKGVNWNDGEDITYGDLNDGQRFLGAKLFDQLIERLVPARTGADQEFNSEAGADVSTAWAYALTVGGATPKQGSANNKVKISTGTLFQKIANSTGNEAQFLAYTFPGTDEVSIANGDPAHPRIDLVCMQLQYVTDDSQSRDFKDAVTGANSTQVLNKKRRVSCTLTVVTGAPAVAPAYPAASAGTVPICAVFVPTSYTGAAPFAYFDGNVGVIHDLRVPLDVQVYSVAAINGSYDPAKWTVQQFRDSIKCTDITGNPRLFIPCPIRKGRLIGIDVTSKNTGATTASINTVTAPSSAADGLVDASGALTAGGAFATAHLGAAAIDTGPIIGVNDSPCTITGNGTHGPPVWCSGERCPSEARTIAGGNTPRSQVGFYINAPVLNTEIGLVTFYVAEGL